MAKTGSQNLSQLPIHFMSLWCDIEDGFELKMINFRLDFTYRFSIVKSHLNQKRHFLMLYFTH